MATNQHFETLGRMEAAVDASALAIEVLPSSLDVNIDALTPESMAELQQWALIYGAAVKSVTGQEIYLSNPPAEEPVDKVAEEIL